MSKAKGFITPIIILSESSLVIFILIFPFLGAWFDISNVKISENCLRVRYDIIGCGGLAVEILDGSEEVISAFADEYPDIGKNEIVFTEDSDEPLNYVDKGHFFTGGFAEKYSFVIKGKAVGVTEGAPDCCSPEPAYNEHAVEFKVDDWFYTSPFAYLEIDFVKTFVAVICMWGIMISLLWLLIELICFALKRLHCANK